MSERKVLNKYYPPDFDPLKIPRLRLPKDRQYTVRLMAPCNMKCKTCGEYIYKGKKFNARKETVTNEEYLSIKVFRFYIKCPRCLAEITFKTDPKNADYVVEHGATRNFQALKLAEEAAEKEAKDAEEEEKSNPMKLLENRTKASKQEMDLLEALEELKDLNQRQANVDYEGMISKYDRMAQDAKKRQEDDDENFIRKVFGHAEDGPVIKRLADPDSDDDKKPKRLMVSNVERKKNPTLTLTEDSQPKKPTKSLLSGLVKVKRNPSVSSSTVEKAAEPSPAPASSLTLLANYSGSSDSD